MSALGAPLQLKQPSRKGRKAWRKNVDISEVQDGLEALREEIITHGAPLTEKDSDQIYAIDKAGSTDITKRLKLRKPLKVDEILSKRSAVDAVDSRKRPPPGTTDGVLEPRKRQKSDWVSKKEVQRLKAVAKGSSGGTGLKGDDEASNFDLWAESDKGLVIDVEKAYIPKPKPKVAPATLRHAPVALTATGRPLENVRRPEEGTSYNPTFESWDSLLLREGQKEILAENSRREQAAIDATRQEEIAASATEAEQAERDGYGSAWEGFETEREEEEEVTLAKKRPRRKTPAERNKLNRRKAAERLAKHERQRALRDEHPAGPRKALQKASPRDPEHASTAPSAPPLEPDADHSPKLRRRRLGPSTVPSAPLELVLPDELQDSLRRLRPEGNLLTERFRTLLVNGKVEARRAIAHPPQRKRRTFTEKWTYKDFSIPV